jgi:hypothetical protein
MIRERCVRGATGNGNHGTYCEIILESSVMSSNGSYASKALRERFFAALRATAYGQFIDIHTPVNSLYNCSLARVCIVYQGTPLCILVTGLCEAFGRNGVSTARTPCLRHWADLMALICICHHMNL